jgi:HlyD family secretion protein
VRSVKVDVGERVRAGQLLAEMDPVDLDERAAALQGSIGRAGSMLAAARAAQGEAAARRALASANMQRWVDLGRREFVSPSAVEGKQQELAAADAALAAAQANIGGAEQDLVRLRAERDGLAQQRRNVQLLAPADAVVTARDAEPGSTVVAGQAVLKLAEPGSLWLTLRLDQGRSAGLAAGLPVRIALRSQPQQLLPGRVLRVEPVGDAVTEERIVRVVFDTPPASLGIGELAEATVNLAPVQTRLLVPNAAIQRERGQTGVWRLQDGKAAWVGVRTGATGLDGQVELLEGPAAGERIVVHSDKPLREGVRLRVVEALAGAPK